MTHGLNDDVAKVLALDVCLEAGEQAFEDPGREILRIPSTVHPGHPARRS